MSGVVYRIGFPDGSFYIGATKDLKKRIVSHYKVPCPLIAEKINFFTLTLEGFESLFDVIKGECEDYFFEERKLIWTHKDDFFLLNTTMPAIDPFLPDEEYIKAVDELKKGKRITIIMSDEEFKELARQAEKSKRTKPAQVKYLIEQESKKATR